MATQWDVFQDYFLASRWFSPRLDIVVIQKKMAIIAITYSVSPT